MEKYGTSGRATDDNIIWRVRFACLITKATDVNSEYEIIFISSPLQQWLRELASLLRYTYISCRISSYTTALH